MKEYLIRGSDDPGGGLGVRTTDLFDVLAPEGWTSSPAAGWGDLRISVAHGEVAFSWEEPGWHVIVEGRIPDDEAERMIGQIAAQLTAATGQPTRTTRI